MPPKRFRTPRKTRKSQSSNENIDSDFEPLSKVHDDDDMESSETSTEELVLKRPRTGPSMNKNAIKAREKALIDKFAVVQSKINSPLEGDDGIVVRTSYLAEEKNAPMNKEYDYTHLIKMVSPMPFTLVKQTRLQDGQYKGHVAILFKQSIPFPLLDLTPAIRGKIFKYLLKHDDEVPIMLQQGTKRTAISPAYCNSSNKNNLAILAVNKQVRDEAAPIVYGQAFHFPGTQVVTNFLLQCGQFRKHVVAIRTDTYTSKSAVTMFHLLQECPSLHTLSFVHISSNENPKTAARNIIRDGQNWLLSLDRSDPAKGLDILEFDPSAFHVRHRDAEGNVSVVQWGPDEQVEFLKRMRVKLEGTRR